MAEFRKMEYFDLREEASTQRLPACVGRRNEMERLDRILARRVNSNVMLVGPGGIGKTTCLYGWAASAASKKQLENSALLQLSTAHLYALGVEPELEEQYAEALASLPSSIVCLDDFGREVFRNSALMQHVMHLYMPMLARTDVHVVLTLQTHEHEWLEREFPAFVGAFETMHLKEQSDYEMQRILEKALPRLNAAHRIIVPDDSVREVVSLSKRFRMLGQLPRSGVRLLDESIAHAAAQGQRVLARDAIAEVVEAKTGVPRTQFARGELAQLRTLERDLSARVIGQSSAIARIAATLRRAKLGLRDPHRPLGSFLMLGPSGVGKTETAKCIAEMLFGRAENFVRFDMSEFQQDHTVQRLLGAPAGYVGFEEGGALTNALRKEPHSLILLDEIEKAHPKVFDIFLQVLDDGRITSGQNETVDARSAIVMATSNAAVHEILAAYAAGPVDEDTLLRETVLPVLARTFRLEFINRFDAVLIFRPLSLNGLMQVAQLELRKMEKRLAKHHVRFEMEPLMLETKLRALADPRFGARPVKRFVEETCETLLVDSLLTTA